MPQTGLAAAVASGAAQLASSGYRWRVGVIAERRPDGYVPSPVPSKPPLREIYRQADTAETALRLLRPEYQLTPFQGRDELRVLIDFCERVAEGRATGIAVVHGVGGAGKTRLALEAAERLRRKGWYAGPLRSDVNASDPGSVAWLATVTAPLCVIVDYADARTQETETLLQVVANRSGPPAVVLLTARSVEGDWLETVLGSTTRDAHPVAIEDLPIPDVHPAKAEVFLRTYRALGGDLDTVPVLPEPVTGVRWTTLDLVLLGWVAAETRAELPHTRESLYDAVLDHERRYWTSTYKAFSKKHRGDRDLLDQAAALLTLLSPASADAGDALRAIPRLRDDGRWCTEVADTMRTCLASGPGEGLALRPDPIGDHHLLGVMSKDPTLLSAALSQITDGEELLGRLFALNRAGSYGDPRAVDALVRCAELRSLPNLGDIESPPPWMYLFVIAQAQGGPSEDALLRLVGDGSSDIPLEDLSALIPNTGTSLWRLGLAIDERRLAVARAGASRPGTVERIRRRLSSTRASTSDASARAELLLAVSERRRLAGDRAGALAAIDEAVTIRRALAEANPVPFVDDLIRSSRAWADLLAAESTDAGHSVWTASAQAITSRICRGQVLAAAASWLHDHDHDLADRARDTLALAAVDAGADEPELPPWAISRARFAVRQAAEHLATEPDGLPEWVTAEIPDPVMDLVNAASAAETASSRVAALAERRSLLRDRSTPAALRALAALFPGQADALAPIAGLAELRSDELDAVLDGMSAEAEQADLLAQWVATPTWDESFEMLAAHRDRLLTEAVMDELQSAGEAVAAQHAAILRPCGTFELDHVRRLVTDDDAARDESFDAAGRAELPLLATLLAANPAAAQEDGLLLFAVLMSGAGQVETAEQLARHDAGQLTAVGQRARVATLRTLVKAAKGRPDISDEQVAAFEKLGSIYESPPTDPDGPVDADQVPNSD